MNVKAEVSTTLTIRKMARVEDGTRGLLEAKQAADREFDHYFPKIHPYITRIEAVIVRELFQAEGYVAYLIRVYVTCPLEIVQEFHKAAGVYVDIPPEQITYRYDSEADKKSWLDSLKEGT